MIRLAQITTGALSDTVPLPSSPPERRRFTIGKMKMTHQTVRYYLRKKIHAVAPATPEIQKGKILNVKMFQPSPDRLALARHAGGGKVYLRFSDGHTGTVDLGQLGIDVAALKMDSARESWGSAVEIDKLDGDTYHVDSAVLRARCDPQYAEQLKREIAEEEKRLAKRQK